MKRPNSAVWYHGPSTIDGSLIVGAVSGLVNPSNNDKTGDLFQTWMMPQGNAYRGSAVLREDVPRATFGVGIPVTRCR